MRDIPVWCTVSAVRKTVAAFVLSVLVLGAVWSVDFTTVEELRGKNGDFQGYYDALIGMLDETAGTEDEVGVLWRLSLACLLIGDTKDSRQERREWFARGLEYAERGIAIDPLCPQLYMWHSGNVGKDALTRSLSSQLSAVGKIDDDLDMILNRLGRVDYSEAWDALAEVCYNHPSRSNTAAVNYMRVCIDTIPDGELRLDAYATFAEILYKTNRNASKRRSDISKGLGTWQNPKGSFTDRYACYESALGADYVPQWTQGQALSAISDRQEAVMVLNYAESLYRNSKEHFPADDAAMERIAGLLKEYSK